VSFNEDIVARAIANPYFREVVSTGPHCQVVVMSIPAGGEIGEEVHEKVDQVLVCVEGEGSAVLDGERSAVTPGHLVHVPAGTRHNLVNAGSMDLRLYTIYAPPQHAPGTIHRTKAEADADEADHYAQPTTASTPTALAEAEALRRARFQNLIWREEKAKATHVVARTSGGPSVPQPDVPVEWLKELDHR
jgi:mannose-6-phosphate isomerase-like protein (cupin superfamily)